MGNEEKKQNKKYYLTKRNRENFKAKSQNQTKSDLKTSINDESNTKQDTSVKEINNIQDNGKPKKGKITSSFKHAWQDVKSTPKWYWKCIILGLINCVPILNFITSGYSMRWGAKADISKRSQMPKKYFSEDAFVSGFYEIIIWSIYSMVWWIATFLIGTAVGNIPYVGLIAGMIIGIIFFICNLFWESIISLASIKCALEVKLGQGFSIKQIILKWKSGIGSLFATYFIPRFLCLIATICVIAIISGLFILIFSWAIIPVFEVIGASIADGKIYSTILYAIPLMLRNIWIYLVYLFVVNILVAVIGGFEKVLRYRGIGYWVDMYAKDWKTNISSNQNH